MEKVSSVTKNNAELRVQLKEAASWLGVCRSRISLGRLSASPELLYQLATYVSKKLRCP